MLTDNHFDEYIKQSDKVSLHEKINYDYFPRETKDLKNIIFYGPNGVGKYTQMLKAIKKYSPSELKYEKRITVTFNKNDYIFKISDIHFEVDMGLLGCNSKVLWNEIYKNIVDIILARSANKIGIIVCKNFNEIHGELLEVFYSYMQKASYLVDIKYILMTDSVGFFPNNIYNNCKLIRIPRPSKKSYGKISNVPSDIELADIINIKNLKLGIKIKNYNKPICDNIIDDLLSTKKLDFQELRNKIYNIFTFNLNIGDCLWYILFDLINRGKLKDEYILDAYIELVKFLFQYNNNYRPIYHLENYLLYLLTKIHEF